MYELCSDKNLTNLWPSIQRKLSAFSGRLHLWLHSSELLRREVAANQAVVGPNDDSATRQLRESLRSGQVYVPQNLKVIVDAAFRQREIDSMAKVAPMAREFGTIIAKAFQSTGVQKPSKDDLAGRVRDNLSDERLIRWALRACYGNANYPETYIPDAENRVNALWFSFHNARATLALIGSFLKKYGLVDNPGQKFPNTKLDLEYLALLHYADALASDEVGDMAELFRWLYGVTKKRITSSALMGAIPSADDIRLGAYWRWEATARTHGHALDDWLGSETAQYESMWQKL